MPYVTQKALLSSTYSVFLYIPKLNSVSHHQASSHILISGSFSYSSFNTKIVYTYVHTGRFPPKPIKTGFSILHFAEFSLFKVRKESTMDLTREEQG